MGMRMRFNGERAVRLPGLGLLVEPGAVIEVAAGTVLPPTFTKVTTSKPKKDDKP